jgi:hypothetical protein
MPHNKTGAMHWMTWIWTVCWISWLDVGRWSMSMAWIPILRSKNLDKGDGLKMFKVIDPRMLEGLTNVNVNVTRTTQIC